MTYEIHNFGFLEDRLMFRVVGITGARPGVNTDAVVYLKPGDTWEGHSFADALKWKDGPQTIEKKGETELVS